VTSAERDHEDTLRRESGDGLRTSVVAATLDSFDSEIGSRVDVLVEFWAPWCRPSWMMHPLVARIASEYAGRLKVVTLNAGDAPGVASRCGVHGVPLFVLFRDGSELDRRVGTAPIGQLREWLERHLVPAASPVASADRAAL
jgi:putative thioredoxin